MGLWSRALAGVRNLVRRDDPVREYRWITADQPTGIVITADTALQISVVWACVMAITNALAACRWSVFSVEGDKRSQLVNDPLDHLLNVRPNSDMTAIAFKEATLFAGLTWGNGYAEIIKNARGQIFELWPLLPDRMVPRRRTVKPYRLYYEYFQQDGGRIELEAEQVYHLRGPGITGLMGDNLVARAAKSMSLAAAQERFSSTYFGNNTNLGGMLKHPRKLTPEAHDRLKKDFEDKYKGPFKSNRPAILEEGMEWMPFATNAEAAQLVQSRTFQVEEVCRWFGVPPHKVQHLLRATFNNIEHLGIEFVRDALTPWAKRLEQEADFKLFPQRAPWRATELDMGWLTHGDAKSRFEAYTLGRNAGVYSVNDILRMERKNTIGPEGDVRIVMSNMTTVEGIQKSVDQIGKTAPGAPGPAGGRGGAGGQDAGAPASGDAPPGDQQGPDGGALRDSLARDAFGMVFASVLDRYAKRVANREADLRRRELPDGKIRVHLADLREQLRPWLIEEARSGIDLAAKACPAADPSIEIRLLQAADAIDNGKDPGAAAEEVVAAIWPTTGTETSGC